MPDFHHGKVGRAKLIVLNNWIPSSCSHPDQPERIIKMLMAGVHWKKKKKKNHTNNPSWKHEEGAQN